MEQKYCELCKITYYSGYWYHYGSFTHQQKLKWKREAKVAAKREEQKENDFACQLASALEGYELNPGDVVQFRDGRTFKTDIHNVLFEIPIGS